MTINWLGGPNPPSDPSTFNYETAAQKVQRQKAAAQALQQVGLQGNQGQFVKNGDFIGYAGGNTLGSTIARIAASALGAKAFDNADASQNQLGQDSQAALAYQLDPNNSVAAHRAQAAQTQAPQPIAPQGPQPDPEAAVQTLPVSMPSSSDITPIPAPSPAPVHSAKLAAKVLGASTKAASPAATPPGQLSPDDAAFASSLFSGTPKASAPAPTQTLRSAANAISVTGGPQSMGTGADFSRGLAPKTNLPVVSGLPSYVAHAANALGAAPEAPQATQAAPSAPALPQIAAHGPALPSASPDASPSQAIPAPVPVDPQPAPTAQPVVQAQAKQAGASSQPTMGEQIAQLQRIAQTGPMGQQLATAQMNNLFGSKVGRFKTTVMADPVNGGFIKVTEDSATGATQTDRIGSPNGTLVTGQTTDANGNRLNVHKDGSTSPMLDASGKPVVDSTVTARNDDQATKIGSAVQSNTTAQAAIDTALARNQRILQLYHETETGPLMGHLPNVTAKRQELQALLAQDLFGETRNALAGAGDAGGAPKMAQSEFKYMRDNGGLSQTTDAQTAANIIASMNAQLLAQKQALQGYAKTLQSTAPGAASASGIPGRGQTVSAGQWGFK